MSQPADPSQPKSSVPVWLILIIVGIPAAIAAIGVVAALGIYGVRKYLVAAKSAEAKAEIGRMTKDAIAAYEMETELPDGTMGHRLCPSASKSVPENLSDVGGKRYMSSPGEWTADGPDKGFACLRFSISTPQYYMYSYEATGTGASGDSFTARANGDLNGDGLASTFELSGTIDSGGDLRVAPGLTETMPTE